MILSIDYGEIEDVRRHAAQVCEVCFFRPPLALGHETFPVVLVLKGLSEADTASASR